MSVVLERESPVYPREVAENGRLQPRPRAYDTLPYEDEEALESNWHRQAMSQLIDIVECSWAGRANSFVGGNMFIYFDPQEVTSDNVRGPDFFVVKDAPYDPLRKSWVVWDEGYQVPNIAIELTSPSTKRNDYGVKKRQYEQVLRVPEYFVYNPDNRTLRGWRLQGNTYVDLIPNSEGWLWSAELDLWLGAHWSTYQGTAAYWPRFFDRAGQLLLNHEEAEAQARQQAEQSRQQAEQSRQQAEQSRQQAEQSRQQAEQALREKEILAAKLRELGIDPDSLT